MARATDFYRAVFGWDCSPFGSASVEEASFVLFNATGKPDQQNGGFSKVCQENLLSPALHPDNASKERMSVRVTISVASIDEKLKEIEKAGGALYSPKGEIPGGNMGFVARFTDTEKNVMGLWSMQ
jgi:predicted enzyme related to lactoylglutathione lyase